MLLHCNYLTLPFLTLPTSTCFSFHDIYLTCHGFMGCFVLVTEGRREQQRQKAHNNNTATATMTLKQHFFSSLYKTVRNLHWVSLLLIITLSSRLDKNASKKQTKHVETNKRSCCDDDPPHTSRTALPLHPSIHPITCEPPA